MRLEHKGDIFVLFSMIVTLTFSTPLLPTSLLESNYSLAAYHCNSSPEWISPSFDPRDCRGAISRFSREDVHSGGALFEFITVGGQRRTNLPSQRLPRKYTYGDLPQELGLPLVI